MPIDPVCKSFFAWTLLKGNAANWWYMLVQSRHVLGTWEPFCDHVRTEFVPSDIVDRNRDKFRVLCQKRSASAYLKESRSFLYSWDKQRRNETLHKFVYPLSPEVLLAVKKNRPVYFEISLIRLCFKWIGIINTILGRDHYLDSAQWAMNGIVERNTHYRGMLFPKDNTS